MTGYEKRIRIGGGEGPFTRFIPCGKELCAFHMHVGACESRWRSWGALKAISKQGLGGGSATPTTTATVPGCTATSVPVTFNELVTTTWGTTVKM